MTVSPDGATIYLSGYSYSSVTAVQAFNLKLIGTVPLPNECCAAASPDSSTLYVVAGTYPDIAVTIIDAATLQVTQTVPLVGVSAVSGLAISPQGSQLYMPGQTNFQGEDSFTLDLATQGLMAVSVPLVGNNTIAVSAEGTVYVNGASEAPATTADEVLIFDPASQSVKGTSTDL
jgi:hypothetical protein